MSEQLASPKSKNIAKTTQANASTKALSKSLLFLQKEIFKNAPRSTKKKMIGYHEETLGKATTKTQ